MKVQKALKKSNGGLLLLTVLGTLGLFANAGASVAQTANEETRSTSKWQWSDDGFRQMVEIQGRAEFADDYSDVTSVSEQGLVRIEEEHNGQTRRLEVRRTDGKLLRTYYVNGATHGWDDQAKTWLADLLLKAVRQGAIDVDQRVQTLLRQRGVGGVLAEIEQISGDYGRRIYLEALIKNSSLSSKDLERVLPEIARQISSDYEKANILRNAAGVLLQQPTLNDRYFQTLEVIKSDYERRGVLTALLKRKPLSGPTLTRMLESVAGISSDYEKATFLLAASNLYTADARLREAFMKTVESIKSDYERGRVLSALLKTRQIS